MTPTAFILIFSGVLLNAAAQLLLKAGVRSTGQIDLSGAHIWAAARTLAFEPHIVGGMVCYAASLVVWILALSRVEVSIAYPMLSIGYVVAAVAAWYFFGESLSAARLTGIAVIILGVYLVARTA
jgi:multidrug transporter EmrE-like cation transporter